MDYPRTVLVIGNGARENALANALLSSTRLERLLITPANYGVLDAHFPDGRRVTLLSVDAMDIPGVVEAARQHGVDLAVVGPEAPLVAGLADALRVAGIPTVGPGAETARLEGSKVWAKQFMQRHQIPTAEFVSFAELVPLLEYIESAEERPLVLKADGLAAGKGVIVCDNRAEALSAAGRMLGAREFGDAADEVLVEERLFGREISFTCLLAGGQALVLPPSSDYKRIGDGDTGPNTGGMGNIAPSPYATPAIREEFRRTILDPLLAGLATERLDYRGFLFVGTMVTDAGLQVIEFNVRFGDPEAAVVLPLCEADWPSALAAIAGGDINQPISVLQEHVCVAVVIASANYPEGKSQPVPIEGLRRVAARGLLLNSEKHGDVQLLFAGVGAKEPFSPVGEPLMAPSSVGAMPASPAGAINGSPTDSGKMPEPPVSDGTSPLPFYEQPDGAFLATGGRVLTISARAENLSLARRLAYEVAGNLHFAGMKMRSDIGKNPGDWPE